MLLIKEDLLCKKKKKKALWTQHHVQKLRWQIYVPEDLTAQLKWPDD